MVKAALVLKKISHELGLDSAVKLSAIQSKWQAIFDRNLAHHMYPYDLREGTLLVYVDSPVWLRELTYLKKEVLGKLDGFLVKDITFKIGKVVNNKMALPKSRKSSSKEGLTETPSPSYSAPPWVLDELKQIKDDELKTLLVYIINKMRPCEEG